MPRFVLLRHEYPPDMGEPSHWDLMLERNGVLMTWRLLELPSGWTNGQDADAEIPLIAQRIADHRIDYLDYEGPISGNRGEVCRYDRGTYDVIDEAGEQLIVNFAGDWVRGRFILPTAPPPPPPA